MSYIVLVKLQGGKEYRSVLFHSAAKAKATLQEVLESNPRAKRGKVKESFKEGQL